jgi:hypothetical protein
MAIVQILNRTQLSEDINDESSILLADDMPLFVSPPPKCFGAALMTMVTKGLLRYIK